MKFLVIPQLSVRRPDHYMSIADSGYSMVKHFRDALIGHGQEVAVLFPNCFDNTDRQQIVEDFDSGSLYEESLIWYDRTHADYRLLRYGLDQDTLINAIHEIQPDVIWNHIPEAAPLIKACLDEAESKAKLVTMGFWLDLPAVDLHQQKGAGFTFAFDQFSGFLHSDVVGFTSMSTVSAFYENWGYLLSSLNLNREYIARLEERTFVFDFGYSHKEVMKHWPGANIDPDRFNLFFPNRLSRQGYTHAREFIQACRIVMDHGIPLMVYFTNPGKKMKKSELEDLLGNSVWCPDDDHTLTRAEYFETMAKCEVGVSLFTTERYGGCASREYAAAGLKVMWPSINEYARLMDTASPKDSIEVAVDENLKISVDSLVEAISTAYTIRDINPTGKLSQIVQDRCDFEATTISVLDTIAKW